MEYFIKIKDGQAFEHPIIKENFIDAFPEVDINNLPPEFAVFEKQPFPTVGEFETLDMAQSTYVFDNGVWKNAWKVRPMTEEEKADLILGISLRNEYLSIMQKIT